jgi:phosphate transport system substrate-binding protein
VPAAFWQGKTAGLGRFWGCHRTVTGRFLHWRPFQADPKVTPMRAALSATLCSVLALAAAPALGQTRDHIQIAGSSTVYPFSTTVAEQFGKGGKFRSPVVESTGTGGGFKLFCSGVGTNTSDINDASRPITDSERATCAQNGVTDITEITIGYDGIILAGSAKSPGFNVTLAQLWRAVGKTVPVNGAWVANPYKNWQDIDKSLPNRPISVFGPAPNHGTRDAFVELVMDPACSATPEAKALSADDRKKACSQVREDGRWTDVSEDYALIMGKLAGDPQALGAFTFYYLDQNRDKIRACTVEGVAPSLDSIASHKYPISRPLFIYVKKAHVGIIPGLAEFAQEFVSNRAAGADGYLADKGLIPLPKADLVKQQAIAKSLSTR